MNCDFCIELRSAAASPSCGNGIACARPTIITPIAAAAPKASANPNFLIISSRLKMLTVVLLGSSKPQRAAMRAGSMRRRHPEMANMSNAHDARKALPHFV
jgi:hypothetical protein